MSRLARANAVGRFAMDNKLPTILVIEDDEPTRAFVAAALSDEGYAVVSAGDADEGAQLAQQCSPSLILLDLLMPRGGGMRFLDAYREHGAELAPVVVMTAASDYERLEIRTLADGVLAKPFELDDLIGVVQRFCRPG